MKAFVKSHPIWAYATLACVISWSFQLPEMIAMNGNYHFTERFLVFLNIASFGPSLAAIIVTAIIQGRLGVKDLLKRLLQWRVSWLVYLATFFIYPLVLFICYEAFGIRAPDGEDLQVFLTLVVVVPINAVAGSIILGIGPLGEELGWRGFMLPRLLDRHGDLSSSIILGLVWAFWHLPIFLFPEWRGEVPLPLFIILFPIGAIAIAYAQTRLHHWTRGSVLIAILYHGVVNYAADSTDFWQLENLSPLIPQMIVVTAFVLTALIFRLLHLQGRYS